MTEKGTPKIEAERTLSLHRIVSCTPTRRKLATYPQWSEPASSFGVMGKTPFIVKVAFSSLVAPYVRERIWSENQHIEEDAEGDIVLTFNATSKEEVLSWVLSFGDDAELLEPATFFEEMRLKTAWMAAVYSGVK